MPWKTASARTSSGTARMPVNYTLQLAVNIRVNLAVVKESCCGIFEISMRDSESNCLNNEIQ